MAKEVVQQRGVAIRLACAVFTISESCYRYQSQFNAANEQIANWLIRLTDNNRTWGFGLCYLYLRNVKYFGWNHKRIYRIYRELELNLRSMAETPEYLLFHWKYVTLLMPCLRQISATGSPTSPSPNIPTIWLSVNFDFLISHPQRNGSLYFQLVHLLGELTTRPLSHVALGCQSPKLPHLAQVLPK